MWRRFLRGSPPRFVCRWILAATELFRMYGESVVSVSRCGTQVAEKIRLPVGRSPVGGDQES
jgi:hypothetical protein